MHYMMDLNFMNIDNLYRKVCLLVVGVLFPLSGLLAQNISTSKGKADVLDATNRQYLKQLAGNLKQKSVADRLRAEEIAFQQNWLIDDLPAHGIVMRLQRLNSNGQPIYYKTYNLEAAITTGTHRLQPRSDLGLNLTGKGYTVGVWDAGSINEEHRELRGRVNIVDDSPFGTHDTHVAGTIGATGINPDARGMANEVTLTSYDFNNDNAEIAEEAAEGMLISNHSYGLISGWQVVQDGSGWRWFGDESISTIEDYKFGYYSDDDSRVWDDIAYNAPYYLIVKSAGNDRTDVGDGSGAPADGPYDILDPKSVAKNILTVGAVERIDNGYRNPSDVVMSDFSSWGPTDDGRIKPDIVAAGVNIFSSVSDAFDAYEEQSGTSMSAPNATGSLILLQELYARVNSGDFMRAATLKGLAIHTARQATENPGPTYEFGWGLLAADRAAIHITREDDENFQIRESTLTNGGIRVFTVSSDGTAPLVATLSWTDVPGNPVAPTLDSDSLMLVNDLDMRVFSEDSTFLPWILNPANPSRPASRGDNFRDNVEKIEIPNPEPGEYTIVINHKGSLENNRQNFSLIVSSQAPSTNLTPYYWIGNSGDWNDPANWSTRSGGQPANAVPGIDNPVIFDNASFSNPNPTITFGADAEAYNINWYTETPVTFDLLGNVLNVNGSIDIGQSGVDFNNGMLRFTGQSSKGNYIRIPENALADVDIEINGINARWNLLSDLSTQNITIQGGGLSVVDRALRANNIDVPLGFDQDLNLSGSVVSGLQSINLNQNLSADFSNATLNFVSSGGEADFVLNGAGKSLGTIVVGANSNLQINGDNRFSKLRVAGGLKLNGNNVIDTLEMTAQGDLVFQGGTTQRINNEFNGIGSADNMIQISAEGGGVANLIAENETARYCFDFISVQNVSVSGITPFVAGDNSELGSNTNGWIPGNCDNLLFANFEADFLCPQGVATFIDQSTGDPVSWTWNFDDPQFSGQDIDERNPEYQFRFEGTYTVTLTISNGETTSTRTREIVVPPNTSGLTVPEVVLNGDSLFASVAAPAYQWYKDGSPIEGANQRALPLGTDPDIGSYTVEISNQECRFISEALLVNAVLSSETAKDISIYPNPAEELLRISFGSSRSGDDIKVDIFSIDGNKVLGHVQKANALSDDLQIPIQYLRSGTYIIQIRQGDRLYSSRLLKR
jgi:PKD repeat protein